MEGSVVKIRVSRHVKGLVYEDWTTCEVKVGKGVPGEKVEVEGKGGKVAGVRYRLEGWGDYVGKPMPCSGKVGEIELCTVEYKLYT